MSLFKKDLFRRHDDDLAVDIASFLRREHKINIDSDSIKMFLRERNYEIYMHFPKEIPTLKWRLSAPLLWIVLIVLSILSPIKYIITGSTTYDINFIKNWMRRINL